MVIRAVNKMKLLDAIIDSRLPLDEHVISLYLNANKNISLHPRPSAPVCLKNNFTRKLWKGYISSGSIS